MLLSSFLQVNLNGLTGLIQFNKEGERKGFDFEILNLRNNSFSKVGRIGYIADSYLLCHEVALLKIINTLSTYDCHCLLGTKQVKAVNLYSLPRKSNKS